MKKARYNIALIGKTGVGKSALINALLGVNVAAVGTGKPVTKPGFHPYDFDCGKVPTTLFDSWGLEAGRADEWKMRLDRELAKRSPQKPPEGWFHTVIYCIGAGGSRVEDFEIEMMRALAREKYRVLVVLTKADQATEEELNGLRSTLDLHLDEPARVVPVCSEAKKTLGGMTHVFGLNELRHEIFDSFWEAVSGRLPKRLIRITHDVIDKWAAEQHGHVETKQHVFGTGSWEADLSRRATAFRNELYASGGPRSLRTIMSNEIQRTTDMFLEFSQALSVKDLDFASELENVAFPRVKSGLRIVLAAISSVLSFTGLGLYLWKVYRGQSKRDLHAAVDQFAQSMKDGVAKLEPRLEEKLRQIGALVTDVPAAIGN